MERYTIGACGGVIRFNDDLRVASGEFAMMALNCNSAFARGLRAKGAPIGHVVPKDAATVGFGYLGILRTSPNPNLGKLFANMLLTEEGQRLIYELTSQDHIGLPGSQQAAELAELKTKGIEPLRVDVKFVSEHPEIRGLSSELRTILRSEQKN